MINPIHDIHHQLNQFSPHDWSEQEVDEVQRALRIDQKRRLEGCRPTHWAWTRLANELGRATSPPWWMAWGPQIAGAALILVLGVWIGLSLLQPPPPREEITVFARSPQVWAGHWFEPADRVDVIWVDGLSYLPASTEVRP